MGSQLQVAALEHGAFLFLTRAAPIQSGTASHPSPGREGMSLPGLQQRPGEVGEDNVLQWPEPW